MHFSILYCDGLKYMLMNNPLVSVKREVYDTVNWWGYVALVWNEYEAGETEILEDSP